jgi:hypothetical protein
MRLHYVYITVIIIGGNSETFGFQTNLVEAIIRGKER